MSEFYCVIHKRMEPIADMKVRCEGVLKPFDPLKPAGICDSALAADTSEQVVYYKEAVLYKDYPAVKKIKEVEIV